MRFGKRLLVGIGLATAVVAAAATPASAAPGYELGVPGGGAVLEWYPDGELFRIYDTACDNHAVYFNWKLLDQPAQRYDWTRGCNTHGSLNLDLAEGRPIIMKVCVNIQAWEDRCSDWEQSST